MQEDILTLTIDRLGINGEGVASHQGFKIFVTGALPSEQIRAQIYERHKSYARANLLEVLTPSSSRKEPSCPYFAKCGGCQLMHLDYSEQLKSKTERVKDALQRIGKLENIHVEPCIASPLPLAYRNKIQLPVASDHTLGLYAFNTHDIIAVDACQIHSELGEKALAAIRPLLKKFSAELKHLLIKSTQATQELLVILVTKSKTPLEELGKAICDSMPEIKGVVQNIQPDAGNVILGKEYILLAGQEKIEERVLGLTFNISAASFFQVNPLQAEKLYAKALDYCALTTETTALDAYCGVGTLSLLLARHAKQVIGIESVPEAIEDAKQNAEINGIHNMQFLCAPAEEAIQKLEQIDVALLNPPRKGCDPALISKLIALKPSCIVYVSCDPATLARDINLLVQGGYKVDAVQPFDMFPQTAHVETVVRLSRQ